MATRIDVAVAQQTHVVHFAKLLSKTDLEKVKACHRHQLDSGVSPTHFPGKRRTFLNGAGAAGGGLPGAAHSIMAKLFGAAAAAKEQGGWVETIGGVLRDIDIQRLKVRVVEFWEYEEGGGLVDDYHYDLGSVVTIVCLVDKHDELIGGVFRTLEADGKQAEHMLERGDVLCLLSHKYHNVTPVKNGYRHSLVLELWQDSYDEDCARMASDPESGFIGCGGMAAARQAIVDFSQHSIEFTAIKARDEISQCLDLVEEFLGGGHSGPPMRGLSFASCSLNCSDLDKLIAVLQRDSGQEIASFGLSKSVPVDNDAWPRIWAHLPEKAVWLDFGDNQLSDADVAPLLDDLCRYHELDKLYLDGNKIQDLSRLCKCLPESRITDLDLGDNNIDDTNMATLVAILPESSIRQLVLGTNPVTAAGARNIINVLPLTCIEVLYLDHTGADDTCLVSLATVLNGSRLCELHMDSTRISNAGVEDLIPHIGGSGLNYVDVGNNSISDDVLELLNSTLDGIHSEEVR